MLKQICFNEIDTSGKLDLIQMAVPRIEVLKLKETKENKEFFQLEINFKKIEQTGLIVTCELRAVVLIYLLTWAAILWDSPSLKWHIHIWHW